MLIIKNEEKKHFFNEMHLFVLKKKAEKTFIGEADV